jgi:ribosomal protein L12E/L44/L45/RPP1/RPP2
MSESSIFAEEWRDCLRAHYTHVVRAQDRLTERTLISVMHEAGFSDEELHDLKLHATMHVDDVGADFVPDAALFEAVALPAAPAPEAVAEEQTAASAEEQSVPAEDDDPEPPPASEEYYAPPDDTPRQLSLF